MIHLSQASGNAEKWRDLFEVFAQSRGMSVAKNQSVGTRYRYYKNHNTRQLFKLFNQIAELTEGAVLVRTEPDAKASGGEKFGGGT